MNQRGNDNEFFRLVSDYCNGTLDAHGMRELCDALEHDAEALQKFTEYTFLHAELSKQLSQTTGEELPHVGELALDMGVCERGPSRAGRQAPQSRATRNRGQFRQSWRSRLALAASLLGVAVLSSLLTSVAHRSAVEAVAVDATAEAAVARITGTRNCRWITPTEGFGFGATIAAGEQLQLAAGLAEITFNDGAQVILEGPATFHVRAPDRAVLDEGRLAAVVPQRARGFEVATANLNVIDLGTEFGLMAGAEGRTEVHVFNGLVKAHVLNEAGQQVETVRVNTAEAVAVARASTTVNRFRANDEQFVRSIAPVAGPHNGLFAYEAFDYPDGPLAGQNGGFGWAGPWEDIEIGGEPGTVTNRVAQGNLAYEGIVPAGNSAVQTAQHNRIRRELSTSIGGVFDAAGLVENQDGLRLVGRDGTTVYLSFLQQTSKIDDVFYGLEMHRGDGNANRVLCIGNGADGCGYGVTSNYNTYGLQNFPALGREDNEVNLIVIRIEFGPLNKDRVTVYRNPESLFNEALSQNDAILKGNFAFDRVSLGNFEGAKVHRIDELRIGTSYLSVTGRQPHDGNRLLEPVAGRFFGPHSPRISRKLVDKTVFSDYHKVSRNDGRAHTLN